MTGIGTDGGKSDVRHPPVEDGTKRRPWWRKKRFIIPAALILVVLALPLLGNHSDTSTAPSGASTATAASGGRRAATHAADTSPAIGQPAKDGKFTFVVRSVRPGIPRVGTDLLNATAQGQFVLIAVDVSNHGDKPQTFFTSNITAKDKSGRQYNPDDIASAYASDNYDFSADINPGNKVSAVVVFDIPKGDSLTRVTLHDSAFSGGVTVRLH